MRHCERGEFRIMHVFRRGILMRAQLMFRGQFECPFCRKHYMPNKLRGKCPGLMCRAWVHTLVSDAVSIEQVKAFKKTRRGGTENGAQSRGV